MTAEPKGKHHQNSQAKGPDLDDTLESHPQDDTEEAGPDKNVAHSRPTG